MSVQCMYSSWLLNKEEFLKDQVTAPYAETKKEDVWMKNKKNRGYKHVPHKDKPAQAVEKRNARERRRVQAVNLAFAKLRKMVPVEHARGKRISKVKTLQYAMDYIQAMLQLLEEDRRYHYVTQYYPNEDLLDCFNFNEEM